MRSKTKPAAKKPAKIKKSDDETTVHCSSLVTNVLGGEEEAKLKRKRKKYQKEVLHQAVQAVKEGRLSMRKASIAYGIPVTSLSRTVKRPDRNLKNGPKNVLTLEEENRVCEWMSHRAKIGSPVTRAQLLENIQLHVLGGNRETPFTNGKPGRHWYEAFRNRHPELTIRTHLTTARASATEDHVRSWFGEIEEYLSQKELLNIDGSRVFNFDQTGIYFGPKGERVVAEKGTPAVNQITKECDDKKVSVLLMFSANGVQAPPMIVYSYKKSLPTKVAESIPSGWSFGTAENGCMTKDVFYEYVTNTFYPWLVQKEIKFPVILYFDEHSSPHITIPLMEFCKEKQIELITLYSSATHLQQPLDIAFSHPFKVFWEKAVLWWKEQKCEKISNENFAQVLFMALNSMQISKETVSNGFRDSGLVPFNANAIDYKVLYKKKIDKQMPFDASAIDYNVLYQKTIGKLTSQVAAETRHVDNESECVNNYQLVDDESGCVDNYRQVDDVSECVNNYQQVVTHTMLENSQFLRTFEQHLPVSVLQEFQNALSNGGIWTGQIEKTSLFEFWLQIKAAVGVEFHF